MLRCLGQRQLDKERCPEAAGLCSKARPFAPRRAFSVQTKADRHANGSPFGGAGEELATRLRGQGFGSPKGAKKPPFGDCSSGRGSFLLGEPMDSFASTFTIFIICHSPQKSSTVRKVYSHSSLGRPCIFLANYML